MKSPASLRSRVDACSRGASSTRPRVVMPRGERGQPERHRSGHALLRTGVGRRRAVAPLREVPEGGRACASAGPYPPRLIRHLGGGTRWGRATEHRAAARSGSQPARRGRWTGVWARGRRPNRPAPGTHVPGIPCPHSVWSTDDCCSSRLSACPGQASSTRTPRTWMSILFPGLRQSMSAHIGHGAAFLLSGYTRNKERTTSAPQHDLWMDESPPSRVICQGGHAGRIAASSSRAQRT